MTKEAKKKYYDLYYDLLNCVQTKCPGESRHDTAKRIIIEGESKKSGAAQEAKHDRRR
jgi:hypothetical protein